jgi:hypothetical protein
MVPRKPYDSRGKNVDIKLVFNYSLQIILETFFFLKNVSRVTFEIAVQATLLTAVARKQPREILVELATAKFNGNLSNGSRVIARGHTDRHDEAK